jgi:hypothetical protein
LIVNEEGRKQVEAFIKGVAQAFSTSLLCKGDSIGFRRVFQLAKEPLFLFCVCLLVLLLLDASTDIGFYFQAFIQHVSASSALSPFFSFRGLPHNVSSSV